MTTFTIYGVEQFSPEGWDFFSPFDPSKCGMLWSPSGDGTTPLERCENIATTRAGVQNLKVCTSCSQKSITLNI